MKKIWLCLLGLGMFANTMVAQHEISTAESTEAVIAFNALFRELDLNDHMQKRYAITESEYEQLQDAWSALPESAREILMDQKKGWADFASMLINDLCFNTTWKDHVRKADRYGGKEISLTMSKYKNVITVKKARKTLVDLIHDAAPMFVNGQLEIPQEIKMQARERAGRKALRRLNDWEELINNHQHASEQEKLQAVHAFFDYHIKEASDQGLAQGNDYWQSPIETLVRGHGDCDDYAIGYYVSLRLLGLPAARLRVAGVTLPNIEGHAVVFYYSPEGGDPLVLDNFPSDQLGPELDGIAKLGLRKRFDKMVPLWGINEDSLTEFSSEGKEMLFSKDPNDFIPAFATALSNSQALLTKNDVRFTTSDTTVGKVERSTDVAASFTALPERPQKP